MTCKPRAGFTDPKLPGSPGLGQEKFCLDGLLLPEEKPEPSTFPSSPYKDRSQPTFPDWSLKPPAETGRSLLSPRARLVLSPHPLILYPKWPSHQSLLLNCYSPFRSSPDPACSTKPSGSPHTSPLFLLGRPLAPAHGRSLRHLHVGLDGSGGRAHLQAQP